MMPVKGYSVDTPYGKRGSYWSCQPNSSGQGIHTGVDFACPSNTSLIAAISGTIRHRSYGSAFGDRQFAISPSEGQAFAKGEVFYAHGNERLADGTEVKAGDYVGKSGARGNVSGPHLHFEYHADTKGQWTCYTCDDPKPVLDYQATPIPAPGPTNPNKVKVGDTVYVIASGSLNGRSAPNSDASVVKSRPYGDKFVVTQLVNGWAAE